MRKEPDGNFRYICHYIDVFTKYNVLFALTEKTAAAVTEGLQKFVLPYFGLPLIFHTDNGGEFSERALQAMIADWPGQSAVIRGRPRHPQSQGVVERANGEVKRRLQGLRRSDPFQWATLLPKVMCKFGMVH